MAGKTKKQADWNSQAIQQDTYIDLLALLEERYPGKVRRTVEVCPVSVIKTIDNEVDARATIATLRLAQVNDPVTSEAAHGR